jgi:hypothetical protein
MSNKYENAKIYKITSIHSDLVYIGSTIQKLSSRKSGHMVSYKRWLNNGINYTSSYELIKLGDIDICLIEEFPCENKEQLHKRERYYIENTNKCINIKNPYFNIKEYREKHKEKAKEYMKDYYLNNKDKRQEYLNKKKDVLFENRKKYKEDNKDKIKEEQHKYYIENKEKKKEYNKQYYEKKKQI